MKIGMFSDSYTPYVSGVVKSLELFTRDLQDFGHQPVILAPGYRGQPPEEGVIRYPSVRALTNKDFRLAVPFSRQVARQIISQQLDVIHVHSPFIMGQAGTYWARRLGLPLVFTFHTRYTDYVHYFPVAPRLVRFLTREYLKRFCRKCQLILAPSSGIQRMLLDEYGVTVPVAVLPTGVEPLEPSGECRDWLREQLGIRHDERVLLFVGRLAREKNLPFLFRAAQELAKRGETGFRLVIIAGGPEEQNLRAYARELGVEAAIVFAGRRPYRDVVRAYCGADLLVFASLTETQGLVILEAMNTGLPVVAVRATGVEDVVRDGENGFMTGEDVGQFTDAIQKVLRDNNLRAAMAQGARETASEFSSRRQAGRLACHYEQVLGLWRQKRGNVL